MELNGSQLKSIGAGMDAVMAVVAREQGSERI
jgi:hypothetical protein